MKPGNLPHLAAVYAVAFGLSGALFVAIEVGSSYGGTGIGHIGAGIFWATAAFFAYLYAVDG